MTYKEQLIDPRWQRKKTEILTRDNFTCQYCKDDKSTLHVHHLDYWQGRLAWDYPNDMLVTLCEKCHSKEHDREKLESSLAYAFKDKGFLCGDLLALSCKLNMDDDFRNSLLKTLREYQNG